MREFLKIRYAALAVFLIVLFFVLGVYVGTTRRAEIEKVVGISGKETAVLTQTDFSPFWKVWNVINDKYPSADGTSDQARVHGAIAGLVKSLKDPYSVFFNPDETKLFEEEISGNFGGVGMEVDIKDGVLTVVAPFKDTPADRAGIRAGDRILKIDQTITLDLNINEAVKLMRGDKGTLVTLTILHEGEKESQEIKIIRDIINIPTLDTELRPDGIFVIKLYSFSANSGNFFSSALKEFALSKTDKLVLDLRGNPGGYLHIAVGISSWFLPAGKVIVTEDYGNNRDPEIFRSTGATVNLRDVNVLNEKLKFVILIDGGSASASEIVAGAMQDHKRAILVGEKSFGKGSVQETVKITPDTLLKITVAKWLTPNGNLIAEEGLAPDYLIKFTKKDIEMEKDTQMDKAVQLLNNWPGIK